MRIFRRLLIFLSFVAIFSTLSIFFVEIKTLIPIVALFVFIGLAASTVSFIEEKNKWNR